MADTRPLAPTDAELMDLGHECELDAIAFGRAVLAKWGTPQPVVGVEPAQWQKRHQLRTNGEWENTNEHDAKWWRDNSQGWEIRALYTTPQPTHAQAGAVPLIRTFVRAVELDRHDWEDWPDDSRKAFEALRVRLEEKP